VIYDSPRGAEFALVVMSAPVPPYGIIVRYDIGVPSAQDVLELDVLFSTTNITSTNVTLFLDGIDVSSIRVRAYTSVGPGPWSDRAVVRRSDEAPVLEEYRPEALGISLGVVVPIMFLLIILVVWLVRRHRDDLKHPPFPFPPPDHWEIDRSLIEFNELLG
jgi:hypothetical protein